MKIQVIDRTSTEETLQLEAFSELYPRLVDDMKIDAVCGGCCSCATCHVYLPPSQLDRFLPASDEEREVLEGLIHAKDTSRLLCQLELLEEAEESDALSIRLAPEE